MQKNELVLDLNAVESCETAQSTCVSPPSHSHLFFFLSTSNEKTQCYAFVFRAATPPPRRRPPPRPLLSHPGDPMRSGEIYIVYVPNWFPFHVTCGI